MGVTFLTCEDPCPLGERIEIRAGGEILVRHPVWLEVETARFLDQVVVMPEILETESGVKILYRRVSRSGGEKQSFHLYLDYLAGSGASLELVVWRRRPGAPWKALEVFVDGEESTADPFDVAADLSRVFWYVFPARQRGRVLPPVVASWEVGNWIVTACIPGDVLRIPSAPCAGQVRWMESPENNPPRKRAVCWWPDLRAWDILKEAQKLTPVSEVHMAWYPPEEWRRRPDVQKELDSLMEEARGEGVPEDEIRELVALGASYMYSRHLRSIRSTVLACRTFGLHPVVTAGSVDGATEYFKTTGLDPMDTNSWADVASRFGEMPDVLVTETAPQGHVFTTTTTAYISAHSHWPGSEPSVDVLVATITEEDGRQVGSVMAWVSPSADPETIQERCIDALMSKLTSLGVRKIVTVEDVLPIELCSCCFGITGRGPARESHRSIRSHRHSPRTG